MVKVLGGGDVGEETLLQKGPSPTKNCAIPLRHTTALILHT